MNLDFTNLRKITGGDAVMESELFQIFLDSAQECLSLLRQSCGPEGESVWRGQAHAFKGLSFAIGADELGALCREAQERANAPLAEKRKMLVGIEQAYADVALALKAHQSGA
ncbi:MAG TPA: Hpt domain-containing protein [Alphaproteobacteria bacterium]|nr:Hpt domain-containing protein [Alphaproteobacteria bacterium]